MSGETVPGRGELRASDKDREQVVELLRVAAGDGRLSSEELDQRIEAALTARTYGELDALITDLPAAGRALAAGLPKEMTRIAVGSASAQRDGAWVVPQRMQVECKSGSVLLDFTGAVITSPTLEIEASVGSGSVTLVVPPDVLVDVEDVAVGSGSVQNRTRVAPGTPVRLRVHVTGKIGPGTIVVR
ncbi:DUF1707 SHOCT-like domain-containing protein [Microbispora sp. H10670]|uniref:DUF1707 SHOCT-like domain-containing protein n=1 Tax=Microbispora sp. H10670 TaxID=2729108 RepID=UPI001604A13C|nr:DUF1707 domain-containing protein [Microbispora sp. H10670]